MTIRAVTAADEDAIRGLWEAFGEEVPEPEGFTPETWEEAWPDLSRHAREGVALIAEDDERRGRVRVRDGAAGRALARDGHLRAARRAQPAAWRRSSCASSRRGCATWARSGSASTS